MTRSQSTALVLTRAVARAREDCRTYEEFYGFSEQPFRLTPDPKYFYKSESNAGAFELLRCAMRRREGVVVITGAIGTGKTTLCRTLLDHPDRRTFTALVQNPFISEEDLLRVMLQDFGVVSREDVRRGRLAGIDRSKLINTLTDFLLSLRPLGAHALLIVDEAQHLPVQVLEQIRFLSRLETGKKKLLQVVLVGQPTLRALLRRPELRQLDQPVSTRCELRPLTRQETVAYVGHRLTVAGGGFSVAFTLGALHGVHAHTGGIPGLINLLCDRTLLAAFSAPAIRIEPALVERVARTLNLRAPRTRLPEWAHRRATAVAVGAAALAMAAAALAFGSGYFFRADAPSSQTAAPTAHRSQP